MARSIFFYNNTKNIYNNITCNGNTFVILLLIKYKILISQKQSKAFNSKTYKISN